MDTTLLSRAEDIFKRDARFQSFAATYGTPSLDYEPMLADAEALIEQLSDYAAPTNTDELLESELKRRLEGFVFNWRGWQEGRAYTYHDLVKAMGIPQEDLAELRPWLEAHREGALQTIRELFRTHESTAVHQFLNTDVPSSAREIERFAARQFRRYHDGLTKILNQHYPPYSGETKIEMTWKDRSYFNRFINTLVISADDVFYRDETGKLRLDTHQFLRIYGHEGMGHGLNTHLTRTADLPFILKSPTAHTSCVDEAVAQFYGNILFDELRNAPDVQRELGIRNQFEEMYEKEQKQKLFDEYKKRLSYYAITVLADNTFGDPKDPEVTKRRITALQPVTLDPRFPSTIVNHHRNSYDIEGNLVGDIVAELRYAAQPVQRALAEFEKQGIRYEGDGKKLIDRTFLTGYWTQTGFVHNARLQAMRHNGSNGGSRV